MLKYFGTDLQQACRVAERSTDGSTMITVIERFDLRQITQRNGDTYAYGEVWVADRAGKTSLDELGIKYRVVESYGVEFDDEEES